MGVIEEIYAELDAEDVSEEEFREAVEEKVEQMGGLADEETAAMLVAREYDDAAVGGVADIEPGQEEVEFAAVVVSVGELRTFDRDEDDAEGRVLNARVADETGEIRVTFWDEHADAAAEELEVGTTLKIGGRPTDGYDGVEVNVSRAEPTDEIDIDVDPGGDTAVETLSLGSSDVTLRARLLATEPVRTFERDDGTEGRVSNLVVGDETGRIRVTLWDGQADRAEELSAGSSVEIVDGYVRERDGTLELHVGDRGRVRVLDDAVEFVPEATPIEDLEIGMTVDIAGIVRSTDPKRTFDRDDGSEGQVRNVRIQDRTGDIRVALWGEKADTDLGPGDELLVADAEIQEGWQDDLEASAGWRATLVPLGEGALDIEQPTEGHPDEGATGLDAFAGESDSGGSVESSVESDEPADGEYLEFTGIVVQSGSPVILDNGERTVTVETDADVTLGEERTVRGTHHDGQIDAEDVV